MPIHNEHDGDYPPPVLDSIPDVGAFAPNVDQPTVARPGPLHKAIRDAMRRLDGDALANPPWLVGPCIMPGDCAYIVGEGGAGKSTFVADILTAIADPTRDAALAGSWRINRALLPEDPRICIINAETSLEAAWRLHLMRANVAAGHGPNSTADRAIRAAFTFLDKDDLPFDPATMRANMETLASVLIEDGFSFVVIDPIYALFAPDSPGDDAWVTVGLKTLLSRLKAAGITTFALAHPPETGAKSLKVALKPYGSSQQKGQMDAHFGLFRPTKTTGLVELVKFKDRRAGWIPPTKARIRLTFNPVGGGYTQASKKASDWEYDNPNEFILSDSAAEYLAKLPTGDFYARDVELANLRRATFLAHVESYYLPQGILTERTMEDERGKPKLYTWTARGARARAQAQGSTVARTPNAP